MLILRPLITKALADTTSVIIVPVKLAAMITVFILTLVFTLALSSTFFPHMSGFALVFLACVALPLTAVGVCKLTFLCG